MQAPRRISALRRRLRPAWKWLNLSEHTFSSILISGVLVACFLLWGDWLQWNNLAASETKPASFLRPRDISDTIGILSGLSAVAIGVQVLARTYQTDPENSAEEIARRELLGYIVLTGAFASVITGTYAAAHQFASGFPDMASLVAVLAFVASNCVVTIDAAARIRLHGKVAVEQQIIRARRNLSHFRRQRLPKAQPKNKCRAVWVAWQLFSCASPGIVLTVIAVGRPLSAGQILAIAGMVVTATAIVLAAFIWLMREFRKPDVSDRISAGLLALMGITIVLLLWLSIAVDSDVGGAAVLAVSTTPIVTGWISLRTRLAPRQHASPQRAWLLSSDWWPGALVRVVVSGVLRRSLLRTAKALRSLKKALRETRDECSLSDPAVTVALMPSGKGS